MRDEVLEEVWRNRDQFAQHHNYDLDAIVAELQKMERHPLNRLVDRRKAMRVSLSLRQEIEISRFHRGPGRDTG